MKPLHVRRLLVMSAVGALVLFVIDFIGVAFFGGINIKIGETHLHSTTLEFPVIGLLVSLLIWLLLSGRTKETALSCFSLIFALGIVEIGLRIVDHPLSRPLINFNRWYELSERYGHQLVKNFEGLGPLQVPVKINSDGFRDIERHKSKDGRTIRILGLGDSFTFGWGVSLEKTYLKRLESTLPQITGHPVETINTGVPGWGLNQYYICLKEFGLQFAPDIVMVGYFLDDLTGPPTDKPQPALNIQWEADGTVQMRGGSLRYSRLFNFFTYLADQIKYKNRAKRIAHLHDVQARQAEWIKYPHFLVADPGTEATAEHSKHLKDHLLRINNLVAAHGASLIILFIPDYAQLFHPEFQHINRIIHAMSNELGITFLDMTPIYEATEQFLPNYLWPLDGHTNEVGHQAITDALLPVVCENLSKRHISCRSHASSNS
ncbi:MAG: SGNH/GDSL hydrolase family protein [Nitrospira sp.]|nr:SGNH/GDSL hydrolase family protein [Nitrospira sp.]